MRSQANASESPPKELTPVKDLSSNCANGTKEAKQRSVTNWYGRLSAEKKEEHLKKLRIGHGQKSVKLNLNSLEKAKQLPEQGNKYTIMYCSNVFTAIIVLYIRLPFRAAH
jgi:hypothetical protein